MLPYAETHSMYDEKGIKKWISQIPVCKPTKTKKSLRFGEARAERFIVSENPMTWVYFCVREC